MLVGLTIVTIAALAFLATRCAASSNGAAAGVAGGADLARQDFTQTWTGSELVVWGGWGNASDAGAAGGRTMLNDGAAYDPVAETWRRLPAAPIEARWGHDAFWDGDEVVIVGGVGFTDGAAYNPATDSWRELDADTPFEGEGWNVVSSTAAGELVVWEGRRSLMWSYESDDDVWTALPELPIVVDGGRVVHVGDRLVAVGLPMPAQEQQLQTAVLAADRVEWQVVEEFDGSMIGDIDVAAVQGDGGESVLMWGSASGDAAWQLADDFTWRPAQGPGLTPCDGAPDVVRTEAHLVVRSLCDDGAVMRPRMVDGAWAPVDFPSDSDPAPVWTGSELVGLGFGGEIYSWTP